MTEVCNVFRHSLLVGKKDIPTSLLQVHALPVICSDFYVGAVLIPELAEDVFWNRDQDVWFPLALFHTSVQHLMVIRHVGICLYASNLHTYTRLGVWFHTAGEWIWSLAGSCRTVQKF